MNLPEATKGLRPLSRYVQSRRMRLAMSLTELAAKTGLSKPLLSQLEHEVHLGSDRSLSLLESALELPEGSLHLRAALERMPAKVADAVWEACKQQQPETAGSVGHV